MHAPNVLENHCHCDRTKSIIFDQIYFSHVMFTNHQLETVIISLTTLVSDGEGLP